VGRLRGFTLIELVVSIALMAIIMTVVIVNVGSLDVARLKTDATKVSAAVKYLHNLAVMNNAYYRLVVDLSSGRYYGEEVKRSGNACGVFVASEEDDPSTSLGAGADEGSSAGGAEGSGGGSAGGGGASGGGPAPAGGALDEAVASGAVDAEKAAMAEVGKGGGGLAAPGGGAAGRKKLRKKANLLSRMDLSKGIRFTGIASEFRKDIKEEGRGTILFFPDGTIEKALVYIESADEAMTVVTEPAMGIARVYPDKRDPRVLEVEED